MRTKLYILALIIMLAAVTNLYAQKGTSLTLSLYDGSTFGVELDNNAYTKPSEELRIDGIAGGRHFLKVTTAASTAPIFSGYINLKEGYSTHAVIDELNSFYVYQKYKYRKDRNRIEISDWEYHEGNINPGYGDENYNLVISERELADLIRIVNSKSFDNTKLEILKLSVDNSYFTTNMVCSLIKLLSFESYKLDLAKYAYGKTVDKRNYLRVFETFDFESSITDLKNYIKNYK